MTGTSRVLRAVLPPAFVSAGRHVRGRIRPKPAEWEYVSEGWVNARPASERGWHARAVAEAHRAIWGRWLETVAGRGPLGVDFWRYMRDAHRDGDFDRTMPWAHNHVMVFGYVLARAAHLQQSISVLDWGSGVGQYYPLARALVPDVSVEYHCKDVPELNAVGRELLPEVVFYDDDSYLERRYDLVVASSSLQYVERWRDALRDLAAVAGRYVLLTRTPTVERSPSFVVVQRAQPYGFGTDVLEWFLNCDEILECAADAGMRLAREFVMLDATPAARAPEQARYRGFLLERS